MTAIGEALLSESTRMKSLTGISVVRLLADFIFVFTEQIRVSNDHSLSEKARLYDVLFFFIALVSIPVDLVYLKFGTLHDNEAIELVQNPIFKFFLGFSAFLTVFMIAFGIKNFYAHFHAYFIDDAAQFLLDSFIMAISVVLLGTNYSTYSLFNKKNFGSFV